MNISINNQMIKKIIFWGAANTFGLYLIEEYLRIYFANLQVFLENSFNSNYLHVEILYCVIITIIGFVFISILRQVPLIRKLL